MKPPLLKTLRSVTREEGLKAGLRSLETQHPDVRGVGGRTVNFGERGPSISMPAGEPRVTEKVRPTEDFYQDLLAIRLGFSEFLLTKVVEHLRHRSTGESTILFQQLVKAQLADIAIGHLEINAAISVAALHLRKVRQLDRQITDLDRSTLRLFGGYGYLRGDVADGANVSEQLLSLFDLPEGR
jgi:hypothetical protein